MNKCFVIVAPHYYSNPGIIPLHIDKAFFLFLLFFVSHAFVEMI